MTLVKFNRPVIKNSNTLSRHLFDELFDGFPFNDFSHRSDSKLTPVNISENQHEFLIEFVAPGFNKEEIGISVEENLLVVSGEHKTEKEKKENNYTRKEYAYQNFKRSFNLPENADTDKIEAKLNNGILTISLSKKTEANKITKQIEIH